MPFEEAALYLSELIEKIFSVIDQKEYQYLPERMIHTPVYNDRNHLERVALQQGEVVAFVCFTLNWDNMICTSCSALAFKQTPQTLRLIADTAREVFMRGFSEITFVAIKDNREAVAMWDKITAQWFEGGRTGEEFVMTTHTGTYTVVKWKVGPKKEGPYAL